MQAGPDNEWLPAPIYRDQIAYGADVTLRNILATADATHRASFRQLAGLAASWYFGNNPAGTAMYDPATGVTFDGVSATGEVNLNSGAESTIHGVLSMLALDAAPDVAAKARQATVTGRVTWTYAEAESGRCPARRTWSSPRRRGPARASGAAASTSGSARAARSPSPSGRPSWRPLPGDAGVRPADRPAPPRWAPGSRSAASPRAYRSRAVPDRRASPPSPGHLDVGRGPPPAPIPAGTTTITAAYVGDGRTARLDGVLLQPELEWVTLRRIRRLARPCCAVTRAGRATRS